jgi:hypothetical protein
MGVARKRPDGRRPPDVDQRPQLLRQLQVSGALARHVSEARKNSGSELVRKLAEERGTGFGMTSSPDEIEREMLSLCISMATLKAKAP